MTMIDLSFLGSRPVAVLGLGRSGVATAEALAAGNVPVWAWDDDAAARERASASGIAPVDLAERDLAETQFLVLSPGIPHGHPHTHPIVERARDAGCAVICDVELLGRAQPDAVFVGVTGTNGKSTTTALIGHILAHAGRSAAVGANIGVPAMALPPQDAGSIYVLELSSYQLELMPTSTMDVAVLLNISPDHLDRHGGMDGYVAAKRRIFRGQGAGATAVIGVDDDRTRAVRDALTAANGIPVSGHAAVASGVYAEGGVLYDARRGEAEAILELSSAPALPGVHNAQNAAAAFAATSALGIGREVIAAAMQSFRGLAHRQELVAVLDGVAYVNDSKATNADAAARALACYDAVYWIAGGRAKEGGLAAVAPHLARVRHAFLIGEAAEPFAAELAGKVPTSLCGTLAAALTAARARAHANGVARPTVLLSPACASFDQFANFEDRGDRFRDLVEAMGA